MITLFIKSNVNLLCMVLILVSLNVCSFSYSSYFIFSYGILQTDDISLNESNGLNTGNITFDNTTSNQINKNNTIIVTTNMTDPIDKVINNLSLSQNDSDGIKMSTCDLSCNMKNSNTQRYIDDLSNSSPDEISTFPINDLEPSIVVQVLNGLSVDNLYKVLHGLYQEDLKTLLTTTLVKSQADQILNKLSLDKRNEILALVE